MGSVAAAATPVPAIMPVVDLWPDPGAFADVLADVRAGDEDAFTTIWRRLHPALATSTAGGRRLEGEADRLQLEASAGPRYGSVSAGARAVPTVIPLRGGRSAPPARHRSPGR